MQLSHVDSGIIGVWRWQAVIATLIVAVPVTIFSLSLRPLWPFAPALVIVGGIFLSWWWPPISYRHLRFGVDETGIAVERKAAPRRRSW